ncbi:MAG: response regulator [Rhodoglobus sp.]
MIPTTVLVVDDSEDQAELLRCYLEKVGCSVTTTSTAEGAIASYRAATPDLAIIDLVLPGMDGWELVAQLRRDVPGCAIAVTSVLDKAKYPTADAILPKPFTGAQVRKVVADLVPRGSEQ